MCSRTYFFVGRPDCYCANVPPEATEQHTRTAVHLLEEAADANCRERCKHLAVYWKSCDWLVKVPYMQSISSNTQTYCQDAIAALSSCQNLILNFLAVQHHWLNMTTACAFCRSCKRLRFGCIKLCPRLRETSVLKYAVQHAQHVPSGTADPGVWTSQGHLGVSVSELLMKGYAKHRCAHQTACPEKAALCRTADSLFAYLPAAKPFVHG